MSYIVLLLITQTSGLSINTIILVANILIMTAMHRFQVYPITSQTGCGNAYILATMAWLSPKLFAVSLQQVYTAVVGKYQDCSKFKINAILLKNCCQLCYKISLSSKFLEKLRRHQNLLVLPFH